MAAFEILLLTDGSSLFRTVAWALKSKGYRLATVSSPEAAIESLALKNYDLLIAKLTTDPQSGMDVVKRARKLNPKIRIIIVSDNHQLAFPLEAYRLKFDDYILMPCSPAELCRRVARCLGTLEAGPPESDSRVRLTAINARVLNHLAIMFHDLSSSLVYTSAALKLLSREAQGHMDEAATRKIQKIHARAKKIVGLSEEYLAHFLSGNNCVNLDAELLDLREEVVEPILDEFSEEIRAQGITIENRLNALPAAAIPIKGSKLYLKSVFRKLLGNEIKRGAEGCALVIDLEEAGGHHYLKIWNRGQPVFEEDQPLLYPGPRRPVKGGGDRGHGLGLRLVKDIIQEQDGDLWYEPNLDGSNFVITLPNC